MSVLLLFKSELISDLKQSNMGKLNQIFTKCCSQSYIIILGIAMHLILLWGVMDANFHSPIIPGLSPIPMPKGAPAKRLFIFVADGLRYRTFAEDPPPYLKKVIHEQGVWGMSRTRMPTESRPGNIAIVAGLYEDPSALFKGWKENPVDFDCIFNHSRASWTWGSPDIISLFSKSSIKNINPASYPSDWQDFDAKSGASKRLDTWVFNRYWNWLKHDAPIYKNQDKIIIFFHLLGCDTTGHSAKPLSNDYLEIMKHVDKNIRDVVEKTEEYFGAGETAYLFTSDHGMTDWGSHGSGSTDETDTPFVAWGAGIMKNPYHQRIEQADLTPLASALLGISVPVNNEGILPLQLLSPRYQEYGVWAYLSNIKQLSAQIRANRELSFGTSITEIEKHLHDQIHRLEQLLKIEKIDESIVEAKKVASNSKSSLAYFRRYQTGRFQLCLTLTWCSWIVILFLYLSSNPLKVKIKYCSWLSAVNVLCAIVICVLLLEYLVYGYKNWRLLSYGGITVISVWYMLRCAIKLLPSIQVLNINDSLLEIAGILSLITTIYFGLSVRSILSVGMILSAVLQRLTMEDSPRLFFWSGILLAMFPLLPVVEPQPRIYIVLLSLVLAIFAVWKKTYETKYLQIIEFFRLTLTMLMCLSIVDGRSFLSWFILMTTPLSVWCYSNAWKERMFGIAIGLLCPLALLSASYEPLYFLVLTFHVRLWPTNASEGRYSINARDRELTVKNINTASYFMLYTLLCFFGTGNMASISSFDPSWTRHFLTVFSPFSMTALILLKTIFPLMIVGCLSRVIASGSTVFSAVLLLGDCLALPLMFGITTEGSWLDIGSAISRFVISLVLPCLLLVVYYISQPLAIFCLPRFAKNKPEKTHLV